MPPGLFRRAAKDVTGGEAAKAYVFGGRNFT
jgi:hypothetical protein